MVRLGRLVRFSINPFLDGAQPGFNSYASKPAGEGLSIFLELAVELVGPVEPGDGPARERQRYRPGGAPVRRAGLRASGFASTCAGASTSALHGSRRCSSPPASTSATSSAPARVDRLTLKLNPFRKLAMDTKAPGMLYFSEKFEFAATHKLWNDALLRAAESRGLRQMRQPDRPRAQLPRGGHGRHARRRAGPGDRRSSSASWTRS